MNINLIATWISVFSIIIGGALYAGAADERLGNAEEDIQAQKVRSTALEEGQRTIQGYIETEQAKKAATEERDAQLCKTGIIDNIDWCRLNGYEVPTDD